MCFAFLWYTVSVFEFFRQKGPFPVPLKEDKVAKHKKRRSRYNKQDVRLPLLIILLAVLFVFVLQLILLIKIVINSRINPFCTQNK